MIRTRRLEIVSDSTKKGLSMKVAFASTDKVHVDEHFGQAEAFYIWEVGPEAASFAGVVQVRGEAEAGHSDDKIEARCSGLADCALVYVAEIGGPAAARLVQKKIHPRITSYNVCYTKLLRSHGSRHLSVLCRTRHPVSRAAAWRPVSRLLPS